MSDIRIYEDLDLTTPIGDGIFQIRLPMAGNPLRFVNGYLIDCGWRADDVLDALVEGLRECGTTLECVRRLAITHFHFDHYGLAGTLLRNGVPALLMHPLEWSFLQRIMTDPQAADRRADRWIERNGFYAESTLEDELQHGRTELIRPTREIGDGEHIGRLRAIWTPGHTAGHLCFHDAPSGRLFTGDHVLDPVTPHVGFWFEERGDPLGEYLSSLRKVDRIDAAGVLPAHGEPFADLHRRVAELLVHEESREGRVVEALSRGPADAATIARALPWTRRNRTFEELSEAHRQFAVSETISHLEHLRARGLVERDATANPIRYVRLA